MMTEIKVELGERSYSVHIEAGLLQRAGEILRARELDRLPLLIVTDENVASALPGAVSALGKRGSSRSKVIIVPAGEDSKSLAGFGRLLDELAEFEAGDGVLIAALGGGVVGDLSGFAAACYKRGTPWIQVPTTLLAQVDASVGGKCAINHRTAKNLIGAFHQPAAVLADLDLLKTLPDRELRSGLAEVIKHGVIADPVFFERIENTILRALRRDLAVLEDYVAQSCRIKAAVVSRDERDTTGRRAILNYGHTMGHAIELAADYKLAHGEAISVGMACAGDLAVRMRLLEAAEAARIEDLLRAAALPVTAPGISLAAVMDAMKLDKKFQRGQNRFVLARRIGEVEIHRNLPEAILRDVLARRL